MIRGALQIGHPTDAGQVDRADAFAIEGIDAQHALGVLQVGGQEVFAEEMRLQQDVLFFRQDLLPETLVGFGGVYLDQPAVRGAIVCQKVQVWALIADQRVVVLKRLGDGHEFAILYGQILEIECVTASGFPHAE